MHIPYIKGEAAYRLCLDTNKNSCHKWGGGLNVAHHSVAHHSGFVIKINSPSRATSA